MLYQRKLRKKTYRMKIKFFSYKNWLFSQESVLQLCGSVCLFLHVFMCVWWGSMYGAINEKRKEPNQHYPI